MRNEITVQIDAPAERVWRVMADLERWPEWTPTMASVKRLDNGEFRLGSRARIRQPKLMGAVWKVSSMVPGRSFELQNSSAGLRSVAGHRIEPQTDSCKVTIWVEHTGVITPLIGYFFNDITRQYLQQEAEGLKKRCEGQQ